MFDGFIKLLQNCSIYKSLCIHRDVAYLLHLCTYEEIYMHIWKSLYICSQSYLFMELLSNMNVGLEKFVQPLKYAQIMGLKWQQ